MKAPSKDVSRSSPARTSARSSHVSEARHGAPAKKNSAARKRPAVAAPKKAVIAEPLAAPKAPVAAPVPVTVFSPQMIRARIGKVCVAIIGSTPAEMVEKATEAVRENPFLEFRLDYLPNPLAAIPKLKQFLESRSEVTAIATCRRASTGGKFKGTIAAELEVLEKASGAGFHLIDVELQTAEAMKRAQMAELRSYGAALIISYHDFEMTKDLDRTFERIRPFE